MAWADRKKKFSSGDFLSIEERGSVVVAFVDADHEEYTYTDKETGVEKKSFRWQVVTEDGEKRTLRLPLTAHLDVTKAFATDNADPEKFFIKVAHTPKGKTGRDKWTFTVTNARKLDDATKALLAGGAPAKAEKPAEDDDDVPF